MKIKMKKVGRNDLCPCGSFKKYKKCCGAPKSTADFEKNKLLLNFVPKKIDFQINNNVNIESITHDTKNRLRQLIEYRPEVEKLVEKVTSISKNYLIFNAEAYIPKIMEGESYKILLLHAPAVANTFYWNEIDQQIYSYRISSYTYYSKLLKKLLENINDEIIAPFLGRQILEFTAYSIANQWAITTTHNFILSNLKNLRIHSSSNCEELEDFVLSLLNWPAKSIKSLTEFTSIKPEEIYKVNFKPPVHNPPTFRLSKIMEFVANHISTISSDNEVKSIAEENKQIYNYLCGFIHITPQAYCDYDKIKHSMLNLTKIQIDLSIALATMKSVINSTHLLNLLFFNEAYCKISFLDLMCSSNNKSFKQDSRGFAGISCGFLKDFMNRHKEFKIETENGPISF